jgi:hypothetical protein
MCGWQEQRLSAFKIVFMFRMLWAEWLMRDDHFNTSPTGETDKYIKAPPLN